MSGTGTVQLVVKSGKLELSHDEDDPLELELAPEPLELADDSIDLLESPKLGFMDRTVLPSGIEIGRTFLNNLVIFLVAAILNQSQTPQYLAGNSLSRFSSSKSLNPISPPSKSISRSSQGHTGGLLEIHLAHALILVVINDEVIGRWRASYTVDCC